MRRSVLLVSGLVISLTIGGPSRTQASTGSPPSWGDVRNAATSLFVATAEGPISDHAYRLTVGPVLIGHAPSVVTYDAVAGQPTMPEGSRWVVITYLADAGLADHPTVLNGRWDPVHSIAADGRIDWGRIVGAPPTLARLLSSFGLPPTDVAPPSPPTDQSPLQPLVAIGAIGSLGFVLWRMLVRRRLGPSRRPG